MEPRTGQDAALEALLSQRRATDTGKIKWLQERRTSAAVDRLGREAQGLHDQPTSWCVIELGGSSSLKTKNDATAATRAFKTKMILCETKM